MCDCCEDRLVRETDVLEVQNLGVFFSERGRDHFDADLYDRAMEEVVRAALHLLGVLQFERGARVA